MNLSSPTVLSPADSFTTSSLERWQSKEENNGRQLSNDYTPSKFSVLCGRGKSCTSSPGNKRLKELIKEYLEPYSKARQKNQKSTIVSTIINTIKEEAPEGEAFVKLEAGKWVEVSESFAREKIGCMFRDMLHTQYRSSTKSKLARKKMALSAHKAASAQFSPEGCTSFLKNMQVSSAANFYSTLQHSLPAAEDIYRATEFQQEELTLPQHSAPSVSPSRNNISQEYCSLLSSYLGQQQEDYQVQPTFLPQVVPPTFMKTPYNMMQSPSTEDGETARLRSVLSSVEQACNLVCEDKMVDHFPENLSDFFDD